MARTMRGHVIEGITFSIPTTTICVLGKEQLNLAIAFIFCNGNTTNISNNKICAGNTNFSLHIFFTKLSLATSVIAPV